jgi:hypothetical protein
MNLRKCASNHLRECGIEIVVKYHPAMLVHMPGVLLPSKNKHDQKAEPGNLVHGLARGVKVISVSGVCPGKIQVGDDAALILDRPFDLDAA